jgi:hypothetical protein
MTSPLDLAILRTMSAIDCARALGAATRGELAVLCQLLTIKTTPRDDKHTLECAIISVLHPPRAPKRRGPGWAQTSIFDVLEPPPPLFPSEEGLDDAPGKGGR